MKIRVEFEKEMYGILAKVSLTSKAGEPKEEHVLAGIEVPLSTIEDNSIQRLFSSSREASDWARGVITKVWVFVESMRQDLPQPWDEEV